MTLEVLSGKEYVQTKICDIDQDAGEERAVGCK